MVKIAKRVVREKYPVGSELLVELTLSDGSKRSLHARTLKQDRDVWLFAFIDQTTKQVDEQATCEVRWADVVTTQDSLIVILTYRNLQFERPIRIMPVFHPKPPTIAEGDYGYVVTYMPTEASGNKLSRVFAYDKNAAPRAKQYYERCLAHYNTMMNYTRTGA